MATYKVMYTDTCFPDVKVEAEVLAKIDAEIVRPKGIDAASLIECGSDCDGILVDYASITRTVIENLKKLKVISCQGIGVDNVDIQAANDHHVMVANVPDYCLDEVADHAFALYLTCARQTARFNSLTKQRIWEVAVDRPIYRLRGQKFALYGLGKIAVGMAQRAAAFGFDVVAFDPYAPDSVFASAGAKKAASLAELAGGADVFSVHAPATDTTRGSVNMSLFKRMNPNCIVVNTARGALINEEDLADAIERKIIAAAGLDVMVQEPPAENNRLLKLEDVVITPHIGFYSEEAKIELRRRFAEEVANALVNGQPQLKAFVNRSTFGK